MKAFLLSGGAAMCLTALAATAQTPRATRPFNAGEDPRAASKTTRMENWRSQRVGLFLHWGPYSAFGGTWQGKAYPGNTEWLMRTARIQRADYREAAGRFDPENYDPDGLVAFAKGCGFKYIVMTAKHYDGFALFDSRVSDFDAVDVLPSKRDLLMEFADACRKNGMPLGYSYAVDRDWYHPGGNTLGPAWDPSQAGPRDEYLEKVVLPQIRELGRNYGPIFTLLADAGPGVPSRLADAFQEAVGTQVVMARDFAGAGDYLYTDGVPLGHAAALDWEKCTCLGNSWGFRNGGMAYQKSPEILRELVSTASKGGNYLLNVGLDGEGRIPEEAGECLSEIGSWLSKYGESIHGTSQSPFGNHRWKGAATLRDEGEKGAVLYLHLFGKEQRDKITLDRLLTVPESAEVMGTGQKLPVTGRPGKWELDLSETALREEVTVVKLKLSSRILLGAGPIAADGDGRFRLDVGRGSYPDSRTHLARTPSSVALQLTGFGDEADSGTWEVFTESPVSLRLRLKPAAAVAEGKRLVISINGERAVETRAAAAEDSTGPALVSPAFLLPAGISRISISGGAEEGSPSQISTSRIELIPAH